MVSRCIDDFAPYTINNDNINNMEFAKKPSYK